jgi:hypothetical protein
VAAPFKPREFEALIIQEDDTLCQAMKNLTQLSTMWWAMVAFKYKPTEDGFTTEYAALITAAMEACPDDAVPFDGVVPNPQDFKNFLLSPTSIFCEKFVKFATGVSQKLYEWIAFEWNDEADDFTDEFKALLCGIDCEEPEIIDINSVLNYRSFEKWDSISGDVDIIGIPPWITAISNPDGMYVDLHGTSWKTGFRGTPGVIRTKAAFAVMLESGKDYEITFRHAGHGVPNSNLSKPGTVVYTLRKLSDLSQYDSVTGDFTAAAWNTPFVTRTINFTASSSEYVVFELTGSTDTADQAGLNVGPKVDTVKIRNTTDDVTLFYDDFEIEVDRTGAVPCGTPDPDTAMNAIPQVSMEVCERMQKLAQAFPLNLYDIASFEFNPAGSGFSQCLKAWMCNPDGTLENGLLGGLVAYWAHDESSGDVLDAHSNGYDLTEEGGTLASEPGKIIVSAISASAAWNDFSASSFTFAAWIAPADVTTDGFIAVLDKNSHDYGLWFSTASGSNVLRGFVGLVYAIEIPVTLVVGEWHFAVLRYNHDLGLLQISCGSGATLTLLTKLVAISVWASSLAVPLKLLV